MIKITWYLHYFLPMIDTYLVWKIISEFQKEKHMTYNIVSLQDIQKKAKGEGQRYLLTFIPSKQTEVIALPLYKKNSRFTLCSLELLNKNGEMDDGCWSIYPYRFSSSSCVGIELSQSWMKSAGFVTQSGASWPDGFVSLSLEDWYVLEKVSHYKNFLKQNSSTME